MKNTKVWFYATLSIVLFITLVISYPVLSGKTAFEGQYLVSFFAPWNTMKFSGWEHGIPFKPIGLDNLNLFFPYKNLTTDLVTHGQLPIWNPYNFAGNVLMADLQSSVFYPLNIFYHVFGMVDGWTVMVIIQPLVAGIFTYLFLSAVGLSGIAALFGSIAFAFSPSFLAWISDHIVVSHTFLWLPLLLFSIEKFIQNGKVRYWFLGIFAVAVSLFAGFAQPFVYVYVTAVVYLIFRIFGQKEKVQKGIGAAGILIFGIGVAAVQLLPTLEILKLSPRVGTDVGYLYDMYLMSVRHLLSFITPDYQGNPASYNFFGLGGYAESVLSVGVVPLVFALVSLMEWKKNRYVRFFGWVFLATLLLGFRSPISEWLYRSCIPIVSTFVPSRIFLLSAFVLSVLAGFGFQIVVRGEGRIRVAIVSLTVAGIGSLFLFKYLSPGLTSEQLSILQRNLLIPVGLLVALAVTMVVAQKGKTRLWVLAVVIFLAAAYGTYFGGKYISFSDRRFVYPAHPVFRYLQTYAGFDRFWTYGDGYINADFATQYRVYSPDGTDALFPSRLGELYKATSANGRLTPSDRIDARIARADEGELMTQNAARLRLLSIVGAKYVTDYTKQEDTPLQKQKKFPQTLFNEVLNEDGWHIYEYNDVLPRVFLTTDYEVARDKQKILDSIFSSPTDSRKIVLESAPPLVIDPTKPPGEAHIVSYTPNEVKVEVQAPENALLFLSDTEFPGWDAFVDGKNVPILRANYAFRAVAVPAGATQVTMRYEPGPAIIGLGISALSLVTACILGFFVKKRAIF